MHRVLHRLPSLDFLRGFEAAGRRLSFTLAAEELFLTQSAISRQIQQLEGSLGVLLFERRHRALAQRARTAMVLRPRARYESCSRPKKREGAPGRSRDQGLPALSPRPARGRAVLS